ncbi:MAG: SPOR domain-containing protein [Bacteroidetes bacterium]|jgi:hypothetical protein|nr:MAG: hypothetical protein ABR90_03660 [Cryomorphaceae bacterium BACL29 MAG-121220-bin8]MDA0757336.1 SPOR domain-containing protein [Bacteroidota bacterium]|tara:strand:- start:44452 stop:45363 length:912 start_codon:yes stop_codon:yes gene_type:complete
MHLSNHISKLLFQHDCVTVPGFGSFIGNYKSAEYDFKEEKFHPPFKQISFNAQIKDNDGLLAKRISSELNLSYDDALKKIHQEVISWSQKLQHQTVLLKSIGELYLNSEKSIVFVPIKTVNHLKDSFGLTPIYISQLTQKVADSDKVKHIPAYLKPVNQSNFFKTAAIWTCLIFGLGLLSYYNINNNFLEQKMVQQQEARNQSKQAVQKAIFDLGSLPSLTLNVKREVKQYYIIAGAFRVSNNAENLVLKLKKKGYDSKILPLNEKGLSPVAFSGYSNRTEAVINLRLVQKKENKDAWLFKTN